MKNIKMCDGLNIIYNCDKNIVRIKYYDFLDLEISELEFAQITAIYLAEKVSIMELCKCYQEQMCL